MVLEKEMAQREKLVNKKWKWGQDSLVDISDMKVVTPSYYDSFIGNDTDIVTGTASEKYLKLIGKNNSLLSFSSGAYYSTGKKQTLHPSCSISIVIPVSTQKKYLPEEPSNKFMPSLTIFGFDSDNNITTEVDFQYSPYGSYNSSKHKFKFDKDEGGFYVEINHPSHISFTNITLKPVAQINVTEDVYQLPHFPFSDLVVENGLNQADLDISRGLIYTTDSKEQIHVSYNAIPVLTYVPANYADPHIHLPGETIPGKVSAINPKMEYDYT